MSSNMFPGIDNPTSRDRLGLELASQQLDMILGMRDIRVQKGLNVNDVAQLMGVDASQVSRFESGSTNPTMSTIRRYAKAVGAFIRITTTTWDQERARIVGSAADEWTTGAASIVRVAPEWADSGSAPCSAPDDGYRTAPFSVATP
ncbi:helix-turn-helix transcriptional regulator [Nocardia vinacea]|uniref:helix-turn-helix domain-containing protein n=1 Tax=Nocardia vinacea TaxID=96468 RepID=UPI003444184F